MRYDTVMMKAEDGHDEKVREPCSEENAREPCSQEKARVHMPRPSSCCIAVTVLSVLTFAGIAAYFSVWDDSKTFANWADRFFSSEKELADEVENGQPVLVKYDTGNWIYFVILCVIFVVNLTIIVPALTVVLRRRCRSIAKKLDHLRNLADKPSVDAIIPCYLPNECEIIEETIWHVLRNVESPGELKLWLVYNTPKDMPELEARLKAISERADLPHGRKLAVIRAESSRSKAENINLVLPELTAKYTVIYDADHHPDPESLMLLVEKIIRRGSACIQGSTYIRDLNSGMLARIVDAEFFVTHFVYFPIMRVLTRNAVFCGSNGLWRTEVLQTTDFSPSMQTEDIDLSVRMLLENHSIDFCPEARSGELAPVSLRALLRQRIRWAIGWDQVSLQLFRKTVKSDAQSTRKAAVSYICYSRWFMQIVGLIAGIVTPILGLVQRLSPEYCHCGMATQLLQTCMFYCYICLLVSCTLEAIFQTHHRGCQSWIQVIFVVLFMTVGCLYMIFQALLICISLFRIGTGTVGGWAITARKAQKPVTLVETKMPTDGDEEAPASYAQPEETAKTGQADDTPQTVQHIEL